jgi:hypothetical protein
MLLKTKFFIVFLMLHGFIFLPSQVEGIKSGKILLDRYYGHEAYNSTSRYSQQLIAYSRLVDSKIRHAKRHYERGNFLRVITLLESVRKRGITNDKEVNQLLSKSYVNYSYAALKKKGISLDKFLELNLNAYQLDPLRPEASYNIAVAYGKKGEINEGIKWLEKSYQIITKSENEAMLKAIMKDPDLNNLRSYSEFNNKFPKLALKTEKVKHAQTSQKKDNVGKKKGKVEEKQAPQKTAQTTQVNPVGKTFKRKIDGHTLNFKILKCEKAFRSNRYRSYRELRGDVQRGLNFEDSSLVNKILSTAQEIVWRECPAKPVKMFGGKTVEDLSNVVVILYQDNELAVRARSYPTYKGAKAQHDIPTWFEFSNYAAKKQREKRQIAEKERKRKELEVGFTDKDTGVKFYIPIPSNADPCSGIGLIRVLRPIGEVPSNIDLTDGRIAKDLLYKGFQFGRSKCPEWNREIEVVLFEGKFKKWEWQSFAVRGVFNQKGEFTTGWGEPYINKPEALAEIKRKKLLAQKRLKKFEKENRVAAWPKMKEFSVNPFVYEGKNIAFIAEFGTMLSATEGLFECSGELFIVSDIPKGLFTKEVEIAIAGKTLGKKETKVPLAGTVLVPNLKFKGAYFGMST